VEILILHPGGLGDIILSLPAISLLRKQFPGAGVTIAGDLDHLLPVIEGYADRAISLSAAPLHRLYAPGALSGRDVSFWQTFDRIISWTGAGNAEFVENLKRINPDAFVASWRPGPDEMRHVSQLFADSIRLAVPADVKPAPIHISAALRDQGIQWLAERGCSCRDPLIGIHPGAGSRTKRWPLENFVRLAGLLKHQEKVQLLIAEGPAEAGIGSQIAQSLSAAETILAASIPLKLLAAVLMQCSVFVGNDSGLAHLAAGLGVPSILLFGPTLPRHWAPLGHHVTVLRNTQSCAACEIGSSDHTCLSNISVEEVLRNLKLSRDRNAKNE
jgi:heptosyltransferase III